jgi:hypothetical protein
MVSKSCDTAILGSNSKDFPRAARWAFKSSWCVDLAAIAANCLAKVDMLATDRYFFALGFGLDEEVQKFWTSKN